MKFCEQCDNMYYISIDENNTNNLQYYCRNCKFVDTTIATDGGCILDTQVRNTEQQFSHIVNKYTKHDPTLPYVYTIKCPHGECASNQEDSKENPKVVYMRYDDANLKYLYICTQCDTTWKTGN